MDGHVISIHCMQRCKISSTSISTFLLVESAVLGSSFLLAGVRGFWWEHRDRTHLHFDVPRV